MGFRPYHWRKDLGLACPGLKTRAVTCRPWRGFKAYTTISA